MTILNFSAWRSITVMLSLTLCLCMFTACSDDDDNDASSASSSPEDNLPEEAKSYVGLWINQGSKGYDWLFLGDGVAKAYPYDRADSIFVPEDVGYWTYDSDTQILATTIGSWQWQVTLTNDEVWTGVSLESETVQTFNKEESLMYYFLSFVSGTSWEGEADSTLVFGSSGKWATRATTSGVAGYRVGFSISGTIDIGTAVCMLIFGDEDDSDYTFTYSLREKSTKKVGANVKYYEYYYYYANVIGTGTITLKNPTSSTSAKLVFTGDIDKTLSITSF